MNAFFAAEIMKEMRNIAILADLHGNLQAVTAVIHDIDRHEVDGVILLGDIIDYGMQSNEVVGYVRENIRCPIICNIWGNHERAIMLEDYTRFSSPRGVSSAMHTSKILGDSERAYLNDEVESSGMLEFEIGGKRCLSVHGSLEDHYWKPIAPDSVRGDYERYDIVFSGHSHCSHFFTKFYDTDDPEMRDKHAVFFINPGSVGQPRNHHPEAQYAIVDIETMSVNMRCVPYDIEKAQSYFDGSVDGFYKDRLTKGI